MSVFKNILTALLVIAELFLIVVVLLQSGKKAGLSGAISGGAETFLGNTRREVLRVSLTGLQRYPR